MTKEAEYWGEFYNKDEHTKVFELQKLSKIGWPEVLRSVANTLDGNVVLSQQPSKACIEYAISVLEDVDKECIDYLKFSKRETDTTDIQSERAWKITKWHHVIEGKINELKKLII